MRGAWRAGVLTLATVLAGASDGLGQGVGIEHDPVGCLVANHYPRLTACFTPRSQLVRARVHFKAAGPDWFSVEMAADQACYTGTLPRPRATTPRVFYYIDTLDTAFGVSRTREYEAEVVKSVGECRKDVLAAPFSRNASVVVHAAEGGTATPPGFVGGGLGPLPWIGAGGAVVAGGVLAGGSTAPSAPPHPTPGPSQPPPSSTVPLPNPTPSPSPAASPSPQSPTPAPSPSPANPPPTPTPSPSPSPAPSPAPSPSPQGCGDTQPPSVSVTSPSDGATLILPTAVVTANASDNVGVTRLELFTQPASGLNLTLTSLPYTAVWVPLCNGNIRVVARAFDACGNSGESSVTVRVNVLLLPTCGSSIASASAPVVVSSLLAVPQARGVATINGVTQAIPPGESAVSFLPRAGANRLEARLTGASGSSGTWSFAVPGLTPGNAQVQAGEVVQLAAGRIVFRMVGRAGERVAFVFRTEP